MNSSLIHPLSLLPAPPLAEIGGKAAGLYRLVALGLPVPESVVLGRGRIGRRVGMGCAGGAAGGVAVCGGEAAAGWAIVRRWPYYLNLCAAVDKRSTGRHV